MTPQVPRVPTVAWPDPAWLGSGSERHGLSSLTPDHFRAATLRATGCEHSTLARSIAPRLSPGGACVPSAPLLRLCELSHVPVLVMRAGLCDPEWPVASLSLFHPQSAWSPPRARDTVTGHCRWPAATCLPLQPRGSCAQAHRLGSTRRCWSLCPLQTSPCVLTERHVQNPDDGSQFQEEIPRC